MPDVYKKQNLIDTGDSVKIPDVSFGRNTPEPDEPRDMATTHRDKPDEPEFHEEYVSEKKQSPMPTRMSREELAEYYKDELDEICEQAAQDAAEQAYADALMRKKAELHDCMAEVERRLDEMQELQSQYMEQYEHELKFLAIEIAEKVILAKIDENDEILQKLVMQTVGSVRKSGWLKVELSEHLVNLVEHMKEEFKKPEYHGRAEVSPIACEDGTCRVTTDDGTVVASVSVQLKNLREAFTAADV